MKTLIALTTIVLALTAACSNQIDVGGSAGDKKKADNPHSAAQQTSTEAPPADSTGQTGQVSLIVTSASSALGLADSPAALLVGNGISLTMARLNIRDIKVRTKAEASDDDAKAEHADADKEASAT